MSTTPRIHRRSALLLLALAGSAAAQSPEWPQAPLKIVVPATPGGTVDTLARLFADGLSAQLRQPVVVDNKPGANGAIAAEIVARAKPDGLTLLMGTSTLTTAPLFQRTLPYQLQRDFTVVGIGCFTPFLLFASPTSQATSVQQLVAYAKANPQRLSVASGDGTTQLASELFKSSTGIHVTAVNYKGGPQMVTDIAAGTVDYGFLGATAVLPMAKAGRVKVLGVASDRRLRIAPDIPTIAEQGVRSDFLQPWSGLVVARQTDRAIVRVIEQAIEATVRSEAFQKRVLEIGSVPEFLGTRASEDYVNREVASLTEAAAKAGIRPTD